MAQGYQIGCMPTNVATEEDRPAIHIALAAGLDDVLFNWVAIGAEEEGVPCRRVPPPNSSDPVAIAYDAAMSSRFGVGVSVTANEVVIHELHMPPEQPVITFDNVDDLLPYCRLAGGNAARLVIRLPFRFELEPDPPVAKLRRARAAEPKKANAEPAPDPALVKAIATAVARIIQERGLL